MPSSDSSEYVVEQILEKRVRRGKTQYLIKWKNCAATENTWEPVENLNCSALLLKFTAEESSKPAKKRGRKSNLPSTDDVDMNRNKLDDIEKKPVDDNNGGAGATSATKPKTKLGRPKKIARTRKTEATVAVADAQPKEEETKEFGDGANQKTGFEKGLVAENIFGITEENNTRFFLIKWKGQDEMEMVPSSEARKYVPEMVIDFYEDRIIWSTKKGVKKD